MMKEAELIRIFRGMLRQSDHHFIIEHELIIAISLTGVKSNNRRVINKCMLSQKFSFW